MTTAANSDSRDVRRGKPLDDSRKRVRCNYCELQQYQAELCRRCRKPLPKPFVGVVTREVPVPNEVERGLFGRGVPAGSLAELEQKAIAHALAEADSAIEAASLLDMGKTMLYQVVAEIFGKKEPMRSDESWPRQGKKPRHSRLNLYATSFRKGGKYE